MAGKGNVVHEEGRQLWRKVTAPASGGVVGDPCLVGTQPGVLLTDQDADGMATVRFGPVTVLLSVKGENAAGNSAVAVNDALFYEAAATPKVNKDGTNGVAFGRAVEVVGSGATKEILVDIRG